MMTPFTPFLIVTSLYDVFIERMEYDNTFHTSAHCDLINTSYSEVTMRKGMKGVIVLHPFNKYFSQRGHYKQRYERYHRTPSSQFLLRGWNTMTPFTSLLIVTSLYEVFVEEMEYDDNFHTSAHCDLTV
jgi:hypothetical protein